MCARYLGFVLLIWFAGVTHAQNENVCRAPVLDGGYYVPEKETYFLKEELTYACDSGRKPVVEGWWATSRCEDGNWVHKPQCIDQNACLPPTIPHGKYDKAEDGWYKKQDSIFVQCDDGYERKDNRRPRCRSGTWSPLPVCERKRDSCSEPPKISHAVIIHQYKEVFSAGSEVQYECEEGYTREGNNIFCERGQWTAGPTCNESSADQGPPASDADVQPEGGDRRGSGAGSGKQPEGRGTTGHQGGSSSTSDSNNRDSRPMLVNIQSCGARPNIEHAAVMEEGPMYLKYQCNGFYKLAGPDTVNCYGDGSWSKLPTCEDAFCVVDPARYAGYGLAAAQPEYMREGEEKHFSCTARDRYIYVRCANRRIYLGICCTGYEFQYYRPCYELRGPF
ncbi:complement factor H-like isoform X3 [Simochromis diagramma]|uniref:complement factor H-like isoform X3 n=1 Tax=Simochromis diagramma TaxID=43689 RepID=UPI001A7ED201|nr:complement factor H-like isoform X3 [Simochromis diagramma]